MCPNRQHGHHSSIGRRCCSEVWGSRQCSAEQRSCHLSLPFDTVLIPGCAGCSGADVPEGTGSADITMADPDATAEEAEAAVRAVLSGSVAVVAFQQACKELPRSVSMISKFLEALEPFTFAGTQKIADVRT